MDFNRTFKFFKKIYHVSVTTYNSNDMIFSYIADHFLNKQKLVAIKMMVDNFNIALTDAKKIAEQIAIAKTNGGYNYHYDLQFKNKKDIINFLKSNLGTYERKVIFNNK